MTDLSSALRSDTTPAAFLRRSEAGQYLKAKYGFCSERSLAKLACLGGGPAYRKLGQRTVLYAPADLDDWAEGLMSRPVRSTSDAEA